MQQQVTIDHVVAKQDLDPRASSMTADDMVAVRRRQRLNQGQLATCLGYARQSVSLWETGKQPIPRAVAAQCWVLAQYGPEFATDPWRR